MADGRPYLARSPVFE